MRGYNPFLKLSSLKTSNLRCILVVFIRQTYHMLMQNVTWFMILMLRLKWNIPSLRSCHLTLFHWLCY